MTTLTLRRVQLLLFGAILFNFFAQVYAFIESRALFGDGSVLLLRILERETFARGGSERIAYLLQAPVLFLRMIEASPSLIIKTFEAAYIFHPFVSLIACYLLLNKRERTDLFVYPLLSFALTTQISFPFSVTSSLEVLSLFWPALLYIYTLTRSRIRDYIILTIVFGSMIWSHETGVACLLLFTALAALRIKDSKDLRLIHYFIVAFCGIGAAWLLAKPLMFEYVSQDPPMWERRYGHDVLPLLSIFSIALLLLVSMLPSHWSKKVFAILCVLPILYFLLPDESWILDARDERFWPVPLAACLGALAIFQRKKVDQRWLLTIACTFLIAFTFRDLRMTDKWANIAGYLRSEVTAGTGCRFIERTNGDHDLLEIRLWTVPILSLLFQESREPTTIVFAKEDGAELNYCKRAEQGIIAFRDGRQISFKKYFRPESIFTDPSKN